jgi:hypothetical protein
MSQPDITRVKRDGEYGLSLGEHWFHRRDVFALHADADLLLLGVTLLCNLGGMRGLRVRRHQLLFPLGHNVPEHYRELASEIAARLPLLPDLGILVARQPDPDRTG